MCLQLVFPRKSNEKNVICQKQKHINQRMIWPANKIISTILNKLTRWVIDIFRRYDELLWLNECFSGQTSNFFHLQTLALWYLRQNSKWSRSFYIFLGGKSRKTTWRGKNGNLSKPFVFYSKTSIMIWYFFRVIKTCFFLFCFFFSLQLTVLFSFRQLHLQIVFFAE